MLRNYKRLVFHHIKNQNNKKKYKRLKVKSMNKFLLFGIVDLKLID